MIDMGCSKSTIVLLSERLICAYLIHQFEFEALSSQASSVTKLNRNKIVDTM